MLIRSDPDRATLDSGARELVQRGEMSGGFLGGEFAAVEGDFIDAADPLALAIFFERMQSADDGAEQGLLRCLTDGSFVGKLSIDIDFEIFSIPCADHMNPCVDGLGKSRVGHETTAVSRGSAHECAECVIRE